MTLRAGTFVAVTRHSALRVTALPNSWLVQEIIAAKGPRFVAACQEAGSAVAACVAWAIKHEADLDPSDVEETLVRLAGSALSP